MKKNAIFEDFFSWATKKNAKTRKEFGIEWKKELSSLRMAPPDMIVLGKEKGESDK